MAVELSVPSIYATSSTSTPNFSDRRRARRHRHKDSRRPRPRARHDLRKPGENVVATLGHGRPERPELRYAGRDQLEREHDPSKDRLVASGRGPRAEPHQRQAEQSAAADAVLIDVGERPVRASRRVRRRRCRRRWRCRRLAAPAASVRRRAEPAGREASGSRPVAAAARSAATNQVGQRPQRMLAKARATCSMPAWTAWSGQ